MVTALSEVAVCDIISLTKVSAAWSTIVNVPVKPLLTTNLKSIPPPPLAIGKVSEVSVTVAYFLGPNKS